MHQLANCPVQDTRWGVDLALGWLVHQVERDTEGWHNRCLGITALAYGYGASGFTPGSPDRSPWAIEAWRQAPDVTKHRGVFANVPRGGIIHWKNPSGGAGHTGISLGDGTFFTNDLGLDDHITVEPIRRVARDWGMSMVGWREPDFAHGLGKNTPKRPALPCPPVSAIMAAATHPPSYGEHLPSGKIRLGSTGRAVRELQRHLGIPFPLRGTVNATTVRRIDRFVRDRPELGADDGTCGPLTYRAITGHD
jgi:hypothetical protein